ncbi:MAG: hypothetical protein JXO72_08840 [Vicinamibacteria bacterium]|nr:hypothetical protein [Vicinamibacteria bacterium]
MRLHNRMLLVLAGLVAVAACGPAEKTVVDKYFRAINGEDNDTLGSFATVGFDQKVDSWKIVQAGEAVEDEAPLPGLVANVKEIEKWISANKKEYQDYYFDHQAAVDELRDIAKKKGAVPPKLRSISSVWDGYVQKERQLKRELKDAKDAVDFEQANVRRSLGDIKDLESAMTRTTKTIDLQLTIEGQPQDYSMVLRQYKPVDAGDRRVISRWVITGLDPKS